VGAGLLLQQLYYTIYLSVFLRTGINNPYETPVTKLPQIPAGINGDLTALLVQIGISGTDRPQNT
jgi:hypothetical protein